MEKSITDTRKYLQQLFNPSEYINVCKQTVQEIQSMQASTPKVRGKWVCVNPLQNRKTRKTANILEFRNFVIEFDQLSYAEQLALVKHTGLPYTTAVFSGNKSIHFVIALTEALNVDEYRVFAKRLKQAFPNADKSCLEPSRLTRIPNRDQPLIAVNARVSAAELDSWLKKQGVGIPENRVYNDVDPLKGGKLLTRKTMRFLAGLEVPEKAHATAIHAAKNLFEVGMQYDEVLKSLISVRQQMLPNEPTRVSEERADKIVKWVYHEWQV